MTKNRGIEIKMNVRLVRAFIMFVACISTSFLFSNGTAEKLPAAEDGVINLSSYDFDNQDPLRLDGMWDFRWNDLLEPGDSRWESRQNDQNFYPVPLFWTSYGDKLYSSEGQGTYRLLIETCGQCRYYGISLPEIFSEYKLWINDELIDARWAEDGEPVLFLKPTTFFIYSESNTLELVLQVRNRSHSNAGIGQSIMIGSEQNTYRSHICNISLDVILIAICMFAGMYHTIIFIFRKEEKELLYFGLFCFILALRTFSTGSTLFMLAFPGMSFIVGARIATIFIPLAVITFLVFSFYFFREYSPRKIFLVLLGLNSLYLILVLATDPMIYSTVYSYYLLIILATCVFIIGVDIYAIKKKKKFSLIFFLGFLILFAGIGNDMMHYLQIVITGYYLSAFFAGFILLESLILSIKFSHEHQMVSELSERLDKAVNTANLDPLTGIYNRRFLNLAGTRELELSRRYRHNFSLVMMDIDNFKPINDQYGHDTGDRVIIKLAALLSSHTRGADIPIRFGGDEFVLLLPHTSTEEALLVAEKVRASVEKTAIPVNEKDVIHFTVSMGVAGSGNEDESLDDIMKKADEMLYKSKNDGRNTIH
ncbi:MAG: diguanylate cyclase [Spirochaetales bacterium]|nr:diguanylate cyclase [Spirochaetales bacterium]